MRTLATALEVYFADNGGYPPDTRDFGPDNGGIDFTFWITPNFSITTPISYLTSYVKDPFWSIGPDVYYQYGALRWGWILASCGPDVDSEDRGDIKERFDYTETSYDLTPLRLLAYDPTNGTISEGDVYRLKQ
jgi:hypothetical protein